MIHLILPTIFNTIVTYNVHYQGKEFYNKRIKDGKTTPKIYDIGMRYIPDMSDNIIMGRVCDIIPVLLPIIVLGNTIYMKKYYYILANIMIIRLIFMNLTILPKYKKCSDENYGLINMITGHCYDKVFSGHFTIIFLVTLFLYEYKIFTDIFIIGILLLGYAILIIALRYHYTIDIAVAMVVTQLVFTYLKTTKI